MVMEWGTEKICKKKKKRGSRGPTAEVPIINRKRGGDGKEKTAARRSSERAKMLARSIAAREEGGRTRGPTRAARGGG